MAIQPIGDLMLPRFRPMLTDQGWAMLRKALALSVIGGLIQGLALLVLLPGAVTLASGGIAWGLGFGGWLVVLAVLAVAGAVNDYLLAIIGYSSALNFLQTVHRKLGNAIARIPLGWFKADTAGKYSRMVSREMLQLGETLAHMAYPLVSNVMAMLVVLAGAWLWDWRLGLVFTSAVPLLYLMLNLSRALLLRGKRIVEPTEQELASRIVEFASCQGALRSCGRGRDFGELDRALTQNHRAVRRDLWWALGANLISGTIAQLFVVALIVVAASLAAAAVLGPIEAIAFLGMSLRFMVVLESIQANLFGVEDRRMLMDQLDEIIQAPLLPEVAASASQPTPGTIALHEVDFGYQPGRLVLDGVSIEVPAHSMCALVGPSGSGKTTLARLIARFYEVDRGSVQVGGADVRELTTTDLMAQLSMVFQDVYLFDDTLEANIRVGNPQASDEQVRQAARLAGVDEIVRRLPQGYQTRVGEGGRALSGGERQRVSVARALLKQAPVVLFDEATSALDAENEANIVAAMQELRRTATLLVIAHKLDTVKAADQIVVLGADGRVAQVGRHAELVDQPGPYRGFWARRAQASGWRLV